MPSITVHVTLTPGRCRWCRCTYENPCDGGCGWADADQTLCTACADLNRAMRSPSRRVAIAQFLQRNGFSFPEPMRERRR